MPPSTEPLRTSIEAEFELAHVRSGSPEGVLLLETLSTLEGLLSEILGPMVVRENFHRMTAGLSAKETRDWYHALLEEAPARILRRAIGRRMLAVNAFAHHGIVLDGGDESASRRDRIHDDLKSVRAFANRIPFEAWGVNGKGFLDTLNTAEARLALDDGQPLEVKGLALLAGVSEHTLRNQAAGPKAWFSSLDDGRLPNHEARIWLGKSKKFRPSSWKFDKQRLPSAADPDRYYLVPKAERAFHPGLHLDGEYRLGRGRNVFRVLGFDEAVAALQRMPEPTWQERSTTGEWTAVSSNRWVRVKGSELAQIAEDGQYANRADHPRS